MNKIEIQKIGIVGAGNLAWHIAAGINNSGLDLVGVYNRTSAKAEELAARLNTKVVTNFNAFRQCDLILLLVKDDAIREMAAQLQQSKAVIAHTSGNTSLEVLFPHQKTGVFYPLQTFSKDVAVNLNKVPILVEGSTDQIGLVNWAKNFNCPPKHTFLTHGDEEAATTLVAKLASLGWDCSIPEYQSAYDLD